MAILQSGGPSISYRYHLLSCCPVYRCLCSFLFWTHTPIPTNVISSPRPRHLDYTSPSPTSLWNLVIRLPTSSVSSTSSLTEDWLSPGILFPLQLALRGGSFSAASGTSSLYHRVKKTPLFCGSWYAVVKSPCHQHSATAWSPLYDPRLWILVPRLPLHYKAGFHAGWFQHSRGRTNPHSSSAVSQQHLNTLPRSPFGPSCSLEVSRLILPSFRTAELTCWSSRGLCASPTGTLRFFNICYEGLYPEGFSHMQLFPCGLLAASPPTPTFKYDWTALYGSLPKMYPLLHPSTHTGVRCPQSTLYLSAKITLLILYCMSVFPLSETINSLRTKFN